MLGPGGDSLSLFCNISSYVTMLVSKLANACETSALCLILLGKTPAGMGASERPCRACPPSQLFPAANSTWLVVALSPYPHCHQAPVLTVSHTFSPHTWDACSEG